MSCEGEIYGRAGSLTAIQRRYHVPVDPNSLTPEADVLAWVADDNNTPPTISGFLRASAELEEYDELLNEFEVEVEWTPSGSKPVEAPQRPVPEQGTAEYRFNFSAQGEHMQRSLETLHGQSIHERDYKGRFKGLINVVQADNDGPSDVEGVDAQPATETFTFAYYPVNALIDDVYQKAVHDLCGAVNKSAIVIGGISFQAETIQLVRVQGGYRTGEDWQIEFGFGYKGIVPQREWTISSSGNPLYIPEHSGHIYEWSYVASSILEETEETRLSPAPYAMYLERLWPLGEFAALELPTAAP